MDAVNAEKTVGYGRTGVARGGYKHVHLASAAFFLDEILEQTGHESGTDILERQGWTMEKFQGIDAVGHWN